PELVLFKSISYSQTDGAFLLLYSCEDNSDTDLEVDSSREGYSIIRVYIPKNEGVKRLKSVVLGSSSTTSVEISITIDTDYLFENAPEIFSESPTLSNSTNVFTWAVSPSSGGGGDSGFFNKLTLVDGES